MSIFKKKLDLDKNYLRVVFDIDEKKYIAYSGMEPISYDLLNRKSKKILDEKNKMLINDEKLLEQEISRIKEQLRFRKLMSLGYVCSSFEYLGPVNGTMSKEMEEYLNKLTSEENVLLGIHRVGYIDSEKMKDILENGLEISGHFGGATTSSKRLENNVSFYPNNKKIIKELMYADAYKNSSGSILIRIPDSDLTGNIFIEKDGIVKLNPKYILGYVPLEPNHHIDTIIKKQEVSISSKKVEPLIDFNKIYVQNEYEEETPRMRR